MRLGRVEISAGALLAAAALLYLDRSGVAGPVLLACVFHELGHWWAVKALGGRVSVLRITCAGAEMRLSAACPLPPKRLIPAALAGPGANFLLALTAILLARCGVGERLYLFAGLNLGLALFNLLPAGWLDGGRVLESLFSILGREDWGRKAAGLGSAVGSALLIFAGGLLFWESGGRNFTVLLAGVWMFWASARENRA